ncbi:MAG: TolC family protein [Leptolyngbya sp. PLA3]|nr:MAG: TolC family protein [Cyanobacteria bacterium CYA]MCE7969721.1 TolC family protein [Leptolyngbya sp. PL-A3]
MPPGPHPSHLSPPRVICRLNMGSSLALLGLLTGCAGSLSKVDARTQKLLEERSRLLGAESVVPRSEYLPFSESRPSPDDYRTPDTINPAASDLHYTVADEARDVSSRLAAYTDQSAHADAIELTLVESFRLAQQYSREYRRAEEDYILAAINLLIEQHRWGPRFFADSSLRASGAGDDGEFDHALDIVNTLRATKRLPYGGEVEARIVWNATEQLRDIATRRYRQSSEMALSADIPLLRGAGRVAREPLIQSERDLVYAARTFERFRRELLVGIASDYFDLVASMQRIENQREQIAGLQGLQQQTAALVQAGQLRAFQEELTRSQVLSAQSSLASQEESFRFQLDRFRIRLGLPIEQPVRVAKMTLNLPEPDATLEEATLAALNYRLDLQNQRDSVEDQKRAVQVARNQLLPDLNLTGDVGVPTDPDLNEGGFGLDPDEVEYAAAMTFGWPLDRRIERLGLRQALISYERQLRAYEQTRDTVIVEARQALRNIELARFRLMLAEQQVGINERRLEEQIARADELEPQSRVDTEIELNNARNNRDQARSDLQVAVLNYLLQSGQLRIGRDGWIVPPDDLPEITEERLPDFRAEQPPVEDNPQEMNP